MAMQPYWVTACASGVVVGCETQRIWWLLLCHRKMCEIKVLYYSRGGDSDVVVVSRKFSRGSIVMGRVWWVEVKGWEEGEEIDVGIWDEGSTISAGGCLRLTIRFMVEESGTHRGYVGYGRNEVRWKTQGVSAMKLEVFYDEEGKTKMLWTFLLSIPSRESFSSGKEKWSSFGNLYLKLISPKNPTHLPFNGNPFWIIYPSHDANYLQLKISHVRWHMSRFH